MNHDKEIKMVVTQLVQDTLNVIQLQNQHPELHIPFPPQTNLTTNTKDPDIQMVYESSPRKLTPETNAQSSELYAVQKILDYKDLEINGTLKRYYLTQWEPTWEPIENLNCRRKIKKFHLERGDTVHLTYKEHRNLLIRQGFKGKKLQRELLLKPNIIPGSTVL